MNDKKVDNEDREIVLPDWETIIRDNAGAIGFGQTLFPVYESPPVQAQSPNVERNSVEFYQHRSHVDTPVLRILSDPSNNEWAFHPIPYPKGVSSLIWWTDPNVRVKLVLLNQQNQEVSRVTWYLTPGGSSTSHMSCNLPDEYNDVHTHWMWWTE